MPTIERILDFAVKKHVFDAFPSSIGSECPIQRILDQKFLVLGAAQAVQNDVWVLAIDFSNLLQILQILQVFVNSINFQVWKHTEDCLLISCASVCID